jgi:hypothetical protein
MNISLSDKVGSPGVEMVTLISSKVVCSTACGARWGSAGGGGQDGRGARGGASLRSADAAQICSNVGFLASDGEVESSEAKTARQIVSERWREGGGLKYSALAETSALDSIKRRVISRWPHWAEQ